MREGCKGHRRLPKKESRNLIINVTSRQLTYELIISGLTVENGNKSIKRPCPNLVVSKAEKLISRVDPHRITLRDIDESPGILGKRTIMGINRVEELALKLGIKVDKRA